MKYTFIYAENDDDSWVSYPTDVKSTGFPSLKRLVDLAPLNRVCLWMIIYIYICVCVCVCVCMCVCVCVCLFVCVMSLHTYLYCAGQYIVVYIYIYIYVQEFICLTQTRFIAPTQKLRQKSELVFLVLKVVVSCHNKNAKLWFFSIDKIVKFLNDPLIGLVGRVFANGSGDLRSIPGRVI